MKKVISLVLAIVMGISIICVSASEALEPPWDEATEKYWAEFEKFANTHKWSIWAGEYCRKLYDLNMIDESIPNDFTQAITREQFCIMAKNTLDYCGFNVDFDYFDEKPFSDTESYEVAYLYRLGIIKGKSETLFCPDDLITREEAAVIVERMCDELELDTDFLDDVAFVDDGYISHWARDAVYKLSTIGIMSGTDKGFEPKSNLTIEQAMVVFIRFYEVADGLGVINTETFVTFADRLNAEMPKDENYMFSPLSIKMAFALAANGAEGETKEEILDVLDIEDLDEFNHFAKEIIEKYSEIDMLKLDIANSVWINNSYTYDKFDEDFKNTAENFYNAETGKVTNANAVDTINSWVKEKTNGKIGNIIDDYNFWAMIVNAIYFKGAWESEFYEKATCEDLFTNADGTQTETFFMRNRDHYGYLERDGVQIIELPFETDVVKVDEKGRPEGRETHPDLDTSMYILAADREINAEEIINDALKDKGFLPNAYIDFYMPKFKIEYSASIKDMLSSLGMEKAFDEKVLGFNKVLEHEPLFITDALHKTYISVDEKGAEAAAVTAIGKGGAGLPPEPIEFKVNKPFYFAIRDNISGEILFMGRYAYAE